MTGSGRPETDPICSGDLMIERAIASIPATRFRLGQLLVKRLREVQEVKDEFWDRCMKEVFPSLLKQSK